MRRQRSLQCLTSAQFLAQARRQVMVRPQTVQGLLGSVDLLPRKALVGLWVWVGIQASTG